VKVGYPYFAISGILFILASIYLFISNDSIPALEEKNIPSQFVSITIALWGFFRLYKAYSIFKQNKNEKL
jgi:hypothetical protein